MKKNNTQAIVLRAGLSLGMLFGAGLQAEEVLAAEPADEAVQENPSNESTPAEVTEIVPESSENTEDQEMNVKTGVETTETIENTETLANDELAEQEDVEDVHNNDSSNEDETEVAAPAEEEPQPAEAESEETLADEVDATEDEGETELSEVEDTPTTEEAVSTDVIEETVVEETPETIAAEQGEMEDSAESTLTPDAMTMSASIDNPDEEVKVDRVYGQNRFKNAVEISKKGWSSASKVFLANGYKYTDSLTGSPLAALNNSPILLTRDNTLPEETLAELKRLNTKEVVILGGELSVSKQVVDALQKNGFTVTRIGGNNRYTQAALVAEEIMKVEGKNRDAFLASGEVFSDALSIATVASGKRLPIFLTRGNRLEQSVLNAIPYVNSWTILGGELTINKSVENQMKEAGAKVKRIGGRNRYDVNRNVLNYYGVPEDHLYVTSGEHYSDTLPASVLAAKENSGVLLVKNDNEKTIEEQKLFAQNKHKVRNYTILGGPLTISEKTEEDFGTLIRTVDNDMHEVIKRQFSEYNFSNYDITLSDALAMQMAANPQTDKRYSAFVSKDFIDKLTNTVTADIINIRSGAGTNHHIIAQLKKGNKVNIINETDNWYQIDLRQTWLNADANDVAYYLNPNNFILSDAQKFQFLDLSRTSSATAQQLNNFLKGKGILEGKGQAFIDAGKKHGVNEIYLLSHALLETGHGTSTLATGVKVNEETVYNMYGIGAYDSDPVGYGSLRAFEEKWFTPEEAIIGGAAFIGNNYVKAGQNTLYKMRWNPESMDTLGYASHQYATDIGWAYKQVNTISNLYNLIGIDLRYADIPVYLA